MSIGFSLRFFSSQEPESCLPCTYCRRYTFTSGLAFPGKMLLLCKGNPIWLLLLLKLAYIYTVHTLLDQQAISPQCSPYLLVVTLLLPCEM